jgi:hypothetical protein
MNTWSAFGLRIGAMLIALLLTACNRGERIAQVNDELRDENAKLKQQVTELTARNKELETELHRNDSQPSTLPDDVRANIPHVTGIEIGRMSFARDTDGDGRPDRLMIYLNPTDGRARFVQIVGTLSMSASILPVKGDPVLIGRATFDPTQVRDAYRSALTGTHYAFEVPIQLPADADKADHAMVVAEFVDGVTGEKFTAERSVNLK